MSRECGFCGGSLEGMRSNAVYCSRSCKTKASDKRRVADGRSHARDRARYAKEAEHRRAYAMDYLAKHPDRCREYRQKRKAVVRGARALRFTDRDWRRVKERYRNSCSYCGIRCESLQQDHVIPIALGGVHSVGNIVPACRDCNYSKGSSVVTVWKKRRKSAEEVIAHASRSFVA